MGSIPFAKMHGLGNDFVLTEAGAFPPDTDYSVLAQKICRPHWGIGADGLIVCFPAEQADARMRIWNADGSEAEMCGNGIRCFVRFLYHQLGQTQTTYRIETLAGLMRAEYDLDNGDVVVDMGKPILEMEAIPAKGFEISPVINQPLYLGETTWKVNLISMGNPHCVIFDVDPDDFDYQYWGPILEHHKSFPQRMNIEFVQVETPHRARIKVWERGAGPTLACGTGACAVLVAGVLTGRMENQGVIELPGGPLEISWNKGESVKMKGPAAFVYRGELKLEEWP